MASSAESSKRKNGALSPNSERARVEEAMGKLDLTEDELTPLAIDDAEDGAEEIWALAGKVLYRNTFHIQTIAGALRPAWGNPRGLLFRPVGENMFVAEFECKRDRDRVWDGAPWHVSRHAVILENFHECMRPSELKFDKMEMWVRILNLPFNLMKDKWKLAVAREVDKNITSVQIDPVGGFLRARATIDVHKPLRRGILISSSLRRSQDWYELQYENVPNFCFSCGRLGHSDLLCPTPGKRDAEGRLPFGTNLRAPDDRKKAASGENPSKDQSTHQSTNQKKPHDTKGATAAADPQAEVTSPLKNAPLHKRKGGPQKQVYRAILPQLTSTDDQTGSAMIVFDDGRANAEEELEESLDGGSERNSKKKKPTPTNSTNTAEAAEQPCQAQ